MSDDDKDERQARREKKQKRLNRDMLFKLVLVVAVMTGFGYAMVPMYKSICEALGVNVIARGDVGSAYGTKPSDVNTQVNLKRDVTVEFDANARGPWEFHPEQNAVSVHPGQLTTVMYEFKNTQARTMTAQAIPSYAPGVAQSHFTKVECFCFTQQTLQPGETARMPVIFFVDPAILKDRDASDVQTITLSYSFYPVDSAKKPG